MILISPAFGANPNIPAKYTCDGDNVSPPLIVHEIPEPAKSLVLIVFDPDAPKGGWVHWTVWNISPDVHEIPENSVPKNGIEGVTNFGRSGYGGPCPPEGMHQYQFRLFALDSMLNLPISSGMGEIEQAMAGHIIEETMLVGLYERPTAII